jgi:hypothetical protein
MIKSELNWDDHVMSFSHSLHVIVHRSDKAICLIETCKWSHPKLCMLYQAKWQAVIEEVEVIDTDDYNQSPRDST